jgi:transcriptional regulator with XRE-family HTH domain
VGYQEYFNGAKGTKLLFTLKMNSPIVNIMNNIEIQASYSKLVEALKQDSRSDAEISRKSGVSQPTVWRLRSGQHSRLRFSGQFNKLYKFYGLSELRSPPEEASMEEQLKSAIMTLWDGSDAHARALIKVIRSLRGLSTRQPDHSAKLAAEGGRNAGHTN